MKRLMSAIVGLSGAAFWLALLEVTSFSSVVLGLGLLIALAIIQ